MQVGVVVLRDDLWTYADAGEAEKTPLATAVRRAGGFEDLGSGMGESNAKAAGGLEDLGSGIGESKATAAGGFEDLGSGMGESRAIKGGGSSGVEIVSAEKPSVRAPLRGAKCGFSFKEEGRAQSNGAPEASGTKAANESMITQIVLLISY